MQTFWNKKINKTKTTKIGEQKQTNQKNNKIIMKASQKDLGVRANIVIKHSQRKATDRAIQKRGLVGGK